VLTGSADSGRKDEFPLSDYKTLAQQVFANMNPAADIYFSQGPTDVLDHSCSKMGFGGKMCIDGTEKAPEEQEHAPSTALTPPIFDKSEIEKTFPELTALNNSLLAHDIPCLIISVRKTKPGHVRELHDRLCKLATLESI